MVTPRWRAFWQTGTQIRRFGGAGLVMVGLLWPRVAHSCEPAVPLVHTIDPALAAVDKTPPVLGEVAVAELHDNDQDGCQPKCGWDHNARIINLATDDMSSVGHIGYQMVLVAGSVPSVTTGYTSGIAVREWPDGSMMLFWDGGDDYDFTVQLTAIDEAGNESAPKTVRVSRGGGCNLAGRPPTSFLAFAAVALATLATRRPARRGRTHRGAAPKRASLTSRSASDRRDDS